ncbi:hypothetical protein BGM19_07160 [Streptomyces agglomeratus]|uniref:ATP-grasp domain-containing protein n=1 Tax=Streptomyces agglomeratus TaxID=285458 RepID=UPI0008688046|nr:ATP-grasp domain-containing protein [Streptomyces agglomeratus]OEJ57781.1 hypothetical protein BGM19_07160 [Streptomyces agglomeratus]
MPTPVRTLALSPRATATGHALAAAARRRGLGCASLRQWRAPERPHTIGSLYAGPLFADAVADGLGLGLLEPPMDWLAALPYELTGRHIECTTVARARTLRRPAFVKPPNDKGFPARVYPDGSGLPGPDAVDDDTPVLVSDIVSFTAEYRLFVLDGEIVTGSRYAVRGELDVVRLERDPLQEEVLGFASQLFAPGAPPLPSAVVVDVGTVDGRWAVVEANHGWASGQYACDSDAVLDVVLRAACPAAEVRPRDTRFLRQVTRAVR